MTLVAEINQFKKNLKKYAQTLITGSPISAQEASAFILGIPNTYCSKQSIFINTAQPDERITMLKNSYEINLLHDESEDICMKNILNYYVQRPIEFESYCLAKFASIFNISKKTDCENRSNVTNENFHEGISYTIELLIFKFLSEKCKNYIKIT